MNILTADDEQSALNILNRAVREAMPEAELRSFSTTSEALREIRENGFLPDVAFLDIKMPGMSGIEMAKAVKDASPRTNIVFVTAFSDYALDAMSLHPSGYVMKPATVEKIRVEIENLRYPPAQRTEHRVRAQCFGNFEVFANGKPLELYYSKSKELLAYLVDRRGAACNTEELCAVLWEDEPDSPVVRKRLRKLISDLAHSLEDAGAADVFLKRRNSFAVDVEKLDCDYYGMLNRDMAAINTYNGEYMTQYSWAEMTLGALENRE
jgi:two-component system LytT family response regulator